MSKEEKQPTIGIEPDAWATVTKCIGPGYGKTQYGKLPVQSIQPGYYSHEKLYSEKSVIGLMKAAYYDGYTDREEELRKMHKAPWTDFAGKDIHEGDIIEHPSGERGRVVFLEQESDPGDQWRVDYGEDNLSRLCLQVGDKGQAVVTPNV